MGSKIASSRFRAFAMALRVLPLQLLLNSLHPSAANALALVISPFHTCTCLWAPAPNKIFEKLFKKYMAVGKTIFSFQPTSK
jgi:hypothetical protein